MTEEQKDKFIERLRETVTLQDVEIAKLKDERVKWELVALLLCFPLFSALAFVAVIYFR